MSYDNLSFEYVASVYHNCRVRNQRRIDSILMISESRIPVIVTTSPGEILIATSSPKPVQTSVEKLETSPPSQPLSLYVIALISSISAAFLLLAILLMVIFWCRRCKGEFLH